MPAIEGYYRAKWAKKKIWDQSLALSRQLQPDWIQYPWTQLKAVQKYHLKKENCISIEYIQIFLSLFPKYNKVTIYKAVIGDIRSNIGRIM